MDLFKSGWQAAPAHFEASMSRGKGFQKKRSPTPCSSTVRMADTEDLIAETTIDNAQNKVGMDLQKFCLF